MSTLALTLVARTAMLGTPGLLPRADVGAGVGGAASRIHFYATARPGTTGADAGGLPLATVVLAAPCGTVASGVAQLLQADVSGDLIASTGDAVWARWVAADGEVLADGDATAAAGAGPFKLTGTDGTRLYAGGRAILGAVALS